MITLVNYILEKNILVKKITLRTACAVLLLQTDGGADHNPQHVAVQAASLALVLLLDLDMAVLIRTVAGHSWANYVKRTMSIFNMAMNGTSLARPSMAGATASEVESERPGRGAGETPAPRAPASLWSGQLHTQRAHRQPSARQALVAATAAEVSAADLPESGPAC
jgi:hypothetical protein